MAQLASAPVPIRDLALGGAVSPDARLRMKLPEDPRITGLVLYRRRADGVAWQRADAYPRGNEIVVKGTVPDSFVFAVATVDAEGNESIPSHPTRLE